VTELDGSITTFNANGTLNYVQDSNGSRITATYTNGLLTQLKASNGSFLALYYTSGHLTKVSDSTGRNMTYTFDVSGQHLLSSTNEYGTTTVSDRRTPFLRRWLPSGHGCSHSLSWRYPP
jgi:hypothetical protein